MVGIRTRAIIIGVVALTGAASLAWSQSPQRVRVPLAGELLTTCFGPASVQSGAIEITWEPARTATGDRAWRYNLVLSAEAATLPGGEQFLLQGLGQGVVAEGLSAKPSVDTGGPEAALSWLSPKAVAETARAAAGYTLLLDAKGTGQASQTYTLTHKGTLSHSAGTLAVAFQVRSPGSAPEVAELHFDGSGAEL